MRRILLLALNDLRLTVRDRASFLWMLVMPVAMMWFLGGLGGGGGDPRVVLSVVNHDDGWLSQALIDELTDETIDLRVAEPTAEGGSEPRVRTLIVPARFTAGALSGEQQTVALEKDSGANVEFSLAAEVHIVRAIVRTLGRLVEMKELGEAATAADASLERFRELARRESLVTVQVTTAGRGQPVPSGRAQSVPGVMTFVVLMMTLIYGGVFLTIEKESGMLLRQAVLPMSRRDIFLGKLVGRLAMAAVQVIVLVAVGRFVFGVSWGDSPLGLAAMLTGFVVAVGSLSTLLGAVLRTPAQASSVGWIGAMVMASLGGAWWPLEVMPDWMQTAAKVFPTAWAMEGFHALISFGRGLEAVLLPSLVLLGFGALFTALGARYLRFGR